MTEESHSGLHSFLLIFWIFSHLLLSQVKQAGGIVLLSNSPTHPPDILRPNIKTYILRPNIRHNILRPNIKYSAFNI